MPITFAPRGTENRIQRISGNDAVRRHLAALGFVAGEKVTIINSIGGNLIVVVKNARIALDKEMANKIIV